MTIQELKDRNLILLECISGSKAYGLDTPSSDTDIKGVFYLPKEQFYGLNYVAQVNNDSNDEVYYELGRFVELLGKNNPNILELLATPEDLTTFRSPAIADLSLELFLSKQCKDTFAGYAFTQVRKARGYKKKVTNPVAKERKGVTDFCYIMQNTSSIPLLSWLQQQGYRQEQCGLSAIAHTKGLFALFYDTGSRLPYRGIISGSDANEVSLSAIPKGEAVVAYLYFHAESYSAYCKAYREYWEWTERRNETRYLENSEHGKNYDAKNMMHTIRLLQVAEEIAQTGLLTLKRPNREELLAIKRGIYDYNELLEMADHLMERITQAFAASALPEQPDVKKAEQLLIKIRTELYQ